MKYLDYSLAAVVRPTVWLRLHWIGCRIHKIFYLICGENVMRNDTQCLFLTIYLLYDENTILHGGWSFLYEWKKAKNFRCPSSFYYLFVEVRLLYIIQEGAPPEKLEATTWIPNQPEEVFHGCTSFFKAFDQKPSIFA